MNDALYTIIFFVLSILTAYFLGQCAAKQWNGSKVKTIIVFTALTSVIFSLLLVFFGLSAIAIRGIILLLILLYASYGDIKTRKVENYIHAMIIITALIGRDMRDILPMLVSALVMGLIFILTFLISKSFKIGGADIKLSIACAFFLGYKSILGLIIGLILAVVINLIQKHKKGFPLIPYLAVGFMTAYLI